MATKEQKDFILFLCKLSYPQLKKISEKISKNQKLALSEIAKNVLKSNVALSDEMKQRLFQYRHFIRELSKRSVKKSLITKNCKALSLILKAVEETICQL